MPNFFINVKEKGAKIDYSDPYIPTYTTSSEDSDCLNSIEINSETIWDILKFSNN